MRASSVLFVCALLAGCGALSWLSAPAWDAPPPQAAPTARCGSECQIVDTHAPQAKPGAPARVDVAAGVLGVLTGNPAAWSLGAQLVHLAAGAAATRRRRTT